MIRWIWALLDRQAAHFTASAQFWATVTDTEIVRHRSDTGEFVTLLPDSETTMDAQATPSVRLRTTARGVGVRLDLAVLEVGAAVDRAVELGATVLAERPDHTVLHSPRGMVLR
ncbi:VOC family protein [Nocardia callitridis]|uniref:Glyoxalase-like domain-containing protein n=1 Tax=Nocardia callitridis TaxID=648753 RepID=A0ABP9KBW9_9NOCA